MLLGRHSEISNTSILIEIPFRDEIRAIIITKIGNSVFRIAQAFRRGNVFCFIAALIFPSKGNIIRSTEQVFRSVSFKGKRFSILKRNSHDGLNILLFN